jgi:copper homeostasis protein CutC
MTITKIYREFGRAVFIEIPSKRGTISAKSGMEATLHVDDDIDLLQQALQALVEADVERVLKSKLAAIEQQ